MAPGLSTVYHFQIVRSNSAQNPLIQKLQVRCDTQYR
jgi:hypothetical protein